MNALPDTARSNARTIFRRMARIAAAYAAASIAAAAVLVATSLLVEGLPEPVEGRTPLGEAVQLLATTGFYAVFTALFAAPVAFAAIAIREFAGWRHPAVFAGFGILAPLPLLFRAEGFDPGQFWTLIPAGIVGGLAFWALRIRRFPR